MNNEEIEQMFTQTIEILERLQGQVRQLEGERDVLVKANKQLIDWVKMIEADVSRIQNNMRYEVLDDRIGVGKTWFPYIAHKEVTLSLILKEGKSLSRFGDGEFALIRGIARHSFQNEANEQLAARLLEVLHSKNENLLVAVADIYGNLEKYKENARREIRAFLTKEEREFEESILEKNRVYHNAYISRPYVLYRDSKTDAPEKRFQDLKQIWDQRDCVFVEGCQTRMGVGNDLFENAASIRRILGPAENAFRKYEELLQECLKMSKDRLFLLALGPTATVLAHDLCVAGYQAIDIGHLDLEYEWFLKGTGFRTQVQGKYNNEYPRGNLVQNIRDEKYEQEIIARMDG